MKIILLISVIVAILILAFHIYLIKCSKSVGDISQPSEPRVVVPSDSREFWTFSVNYSPLNEEEYSKIYNAGYEQISCTSETEYYYASCGIESPRHERTKYNYVFKKKVEVEAINIA